jgi:hypothetical protein
VSILAIDEIFKSLEDFLLDDTAGAVYCEEGQGFAIKDLEGATWAVRKIERSERNIEEVKAVAAKQIARIQAWVDETTQTERKTIEVMQQLLQPWAEKELQGGKKKSLKVLDFTLGLRKSPPIFNRNEEELFAWANANKYTHTMVTTDWATIKKVSDIRGSQLISEDGEIIPGVTVEMPPDKFYVTQNKPKGDKPTNGDN